MIETFHDPTVYPDREFVILRCDFCGQSVIDVLYLHPTGGCGCDHCMLRMLFTERQIPLDEEEEDCEQCGEPEHTLYIRGGRKLCIRCALETLKPVDGSEEFLYN